MQNPTVSSPASPERLENQLRIGQLDSAVTDNPTINDPNLVTGGAMDIHHSLLRCPIHPV